MANNLQLQGDLSFLNDNATKTKVNEVIAKIHRELNHEPLPVSDDDNDDAMPPQEATFSIQDQYDAYVSALTHRSIALLSRSNAELLRMCSLYITYQRDSLGRLLNDYHNMSPRINPAQLIANRLHDDHDISTQSKAISAVKSQVEHLPDFSSVIGTNQPEDVLLYLASLEQNFHTAKISMDLWPLCLPFLSKEEQSVTDALTSFLKADPNIKWPEIKKAIVSEWAHFWNPVKYYYQLLQLKQGNMAFRFYFMEMRTRFSLLGKKFSDEPAELLEVLLRKEILDEVHKHNRKRTFASMDLLLEDISAALAGNPSCDGTATSFPKTNNFKFKKFSAVPGSNDTVAPSSAASSFTSKAVTDSAASSKPGVICFRCGAPGHVATHCSSPTTDAGRAARAELSAQKN